MGIRSKFEGDFKAINLAGMADDMLAQVVADHATDKFRTSNRANAAIAGAFVPYKVEINGRTVHRGKGEILPQQQLALAINPPGRALTSRVRTRLPTIVFDWAWESLEASALQRVLERLGQIQGVIDDARDAVMFLQMVAARDRSGLFLFLLEKYAERKYPEVFARLDQAKALFRVYRLLNAGGALIGRDSKNLDSDEAEVLKWIARELVSRSPVLSGAYRDAHELRADGGLVGSANEVAAGTEIPKARSYVFINPVPYARRLEIGKTKAGRSFVLQVKPDIYKRVAQDAQSRFRDRAEITFDFAMPGNAYHATGAMAQRTPRYNTGELRKQTQTHWVGDNIGAPHFYDGQTGWATFRAGTPKSRIRRGGQGPVESPIIIVRF